MTTGLSGTPMPSYRDSLPEEDRWALAYYVLSLSAFKDPLTGRAAADRIQPIARRSTILNLQAHDAGQSLYSERARAGTGGSRRRAAIRVGGRGQRP